MASNRLATTLRRRVHRTRRRVIGTLTRVEVRDSVAALTFDDGPHPEYTPRLLEILMRHRAHATFFMIGRRAREHPDIVECAAKRGHTIANHSWDHPEFPAITARERRLQLRECARALAPYEQRLFRPPKTLQTVRSQLSVMRLGYQTVAWSVEIEDWREHGADRLAARLVERLRPGSVVVLHDHLWDPISARAADRGPMLDALDAVLGELDGSFRFVTLPELACHGRPVLEPWFVRSDADWKRKSWIV